MAWDEILRARGVWLGHQRSDVLWPERGIAIEGDFAGIQQYVLKPVPGAKGAAKRLRGRSLQVSALTELIANKTRETFDGAKLFYSAGGRFLIFATATDGWADRLSKLQGVLDEWIGKQFRGEVAFHLAAAEFSDGQIPREELGKKMQRRKNRSLERFLQDADGWNEGVFLRAPGEHAFCCPACLATASEGAIQDDEEGERICEECDRDKRLGGKLAGSRRALLTESATGEIKFVEARYTIGGSGTPANVIHHTPLEGGEALSLDEVACKSIGRRKFLAYLRIDADGIGSQFRGLKSASQIRGLSQFLQLFFCGRVQELITKPAPGHSDLKYRWLYPVYGGGDDLFLIGPWNLVLDFAADLEAKFTEDAGRKLTFSAGVSLSKPKQHILTKSEEAEIALNEHAKWQSGKASIRVFGETFSWREFPGVLRSAKKMTQWYDGKLLSSGFLQMLLALHTEWRMATKERDEARVVRHRPMVHYQMERNLTRADQAPVKNWMAKVVARQATDPEASWASIGFAVRYAMLAAQGSGKEEV